MKIITLLALVLSFSVFAQSKTNFSFPVTGQTLMYTLGVNAGVAVNNRTFNPDIGSIWVSESQQEGFSSYIQNVQMEDGKVVGMLVYSEFKCGSEYDESEFYGSCESLVQAYNGQWKVVKNYSCYCNL
jgi:hypothetical protein